MNVKNIKGQVLYYRCHDSDCIRTRAQICKRLSPVIDSKELIPLAYVAWQPGTTNPIRFQAPIDFSKIPALYYLLTISIIHKP
jgi:hypothetical protein